MLPARRRAKIVEALRREGAVALRDLAEQLGMSLSTVRRDVDYLARSGHLERTHGGALLSARTSTVFEPEPDIATAIESAAKEAIGRHAAAMIQPGQSVIFDSGSTTAAAARFARDRAIPFTAVTNDLAIAALLGGAPQVATHVTGGRVRTPGGTLLGAETARALARLRADIAFVGTHALSEEELSDTSLELAEIKRTMIAAADRVVLLADSSKMFRRAFCGFARLTDVHLVVTDARLAPEKRAEIEARGVALAIAGAA